MLKPTSDSTSWGSLCRGGHNGIFLFVLALSWLPPTCPFDDAAITELIDDVLWVFKRMVVDVGGVDEEIFSRPSTPSKEASSSRKQRLLANTMEDEDEDDPDVIATELQTLELPRRPPPTVEVVSRKRKAADVVAPPAKKKQRVPAPEKRRRK